MGSVYKKENLGEHAIMRDVVFKYHSDMRKVSSGIKRVFLEQALRGTQNISMFVEQAVSHVSGLKQSNKTGEDHDDGSDTKVASINYGPNGSSYGHTGKIGNLKNKKGALRVVLFIEHTNTVKYFYVPYSKWCNMTNTDGNTIRLSYNTMTDKVSKISQFEVSSFEDMCKKKNREIIEPSFNLTSFFGG